MKGIKVFGLLMLVVAALAAPASASASGGLFLAGGTPETGDPRLAAPEYPMQMTGELLEFNEIVGETKVIDIPSEIGDAKVTCDVEYDGGELSGPVYDEFTVDPTYSDCDMLGVDADVDMSSCRYAFSDLDGAPGSGYKAATAEIACDEGDAINVDIGGGSICAIEIPDQTLSKPLSMVNLHSIGDPETAVGAATHPGGVEYTVEGSLCYLVALQAGSGEDGSLRADMRLRGVQPS